MISCHCGSHRTVILTIWTLNLVQIHLARPGVLPSPQNCVLTPPFSCSLEHLQRPAECRCGPWTTDFILKTTKDIWRKPSEMPVTLKYGSCWSMALDSYDDLHRSVPRTTASVSAGRSASGLTWEPTPQERG